MKARDLSDNWITQPISRTCEHWIARNKQCGKPTSHAYQALGHGWMALCCECAMRHDATPVAELIAKGETWK